MLAAASAAEARVNHDDGNAGDLRHQYSSLLKLQQEDDDAAFAFALALAPDDAGDYDAGQLKHLAEEVSDHAEVEKSRAEALREAISLARAALAIATDAEYAQKCDRYDDAQQQLRSIDHRIARAVHAAERRGKELVTSERVKTVSASALQRCNNALRNMDIQTPGEVSNEQVTCLVCLEQINAADGVLFYDNDTNTNATGFSLVRDNGNKDEDEGDEQKAASASIAPTSCGHALCSGCAPEWIHDEVVNKSQGVIRCVLFAECDCTLTASQCAKIIGDDHPIVHTMRERQYEAAIGKKMYCHNKRCSAVMPSISLGYQNYPKATCFRCAH